ncbi:MAG: hypothetical protein GY795_39240 [Desulfobacterales bacterium]|nr:hypothetical protein [Desulfobacterales bacterium]
MIFKCLRNVLFITILLMTCNVHAADQNIDDFTRDMRIAIMRGDIPRMIDLYNKTYEGNLKAYVESGEFKEFSNICGYDCLIQLMNFYLFMANEIAYYSSKAGMDSGVGLLKPEELEKYAKQGIYILDEVQKHLPVSGGEKEQDSNDFRSFLYKKARLNYLKAQLYLASGDNWYQSMSEVRLQRLAFLINEAVTPGDDSTPDSKSSRGLAGTYYENALWIIAESRLEIPDDNTFTEVNTDFSILEHALNRRLDSINKGFLFIDIDPDEYPIFSVKKLKTELSEISQKINMIEHSVEALLKEWLSAKSVQDMQAIDEERRKKESSVALSSYKIAQMEDASREFNNKIEERRNALEKETKKLQIQQQKYQLQIALDAKLKELSHRKEIIEKKKEIDVLSHKEKEIHERISDLRWLMNWNIAKANLELQLSSLESQITQYQREQDRNKRQTEQVELKKQANEQSVKIAESNISDAQAQIQRLEKERNEIFQEHQNILKEQLCQIETHLAFLGTESENPFSLNGEACAIEKPETSLKDNLALLCEKDTGLRHTIVKHKIDSQAKVLKCLIGLDAVSDLVKTNFNFDQVECPAELDDTQIIYAKKLHEQEQKIADEQIKALKENIDRIKGYLNTVKSNLNIAFGKHATQFAIIVALSKVYESASFIPDSGAMAGLGGGPITLFSAREKARAAYTTAKELFGQQFNFMSYTQEKGEQIKRLNNQLKSLEKELEIRQYEKHFRNLHALKAIAQITGKALEMNAQIQELLMEQNLAAIDCSDRELSWQENVNMAKSRHRKLLSESRLAQMKNDQIPFLIKTQDERINKENIRIAIANIQEKELTIKINELNADIETLDKLIQQTEERKQTIHGLQGNLNGLEREEQAQLSARKKIASLIKNKTIALNEKEGKYVEVVIKQSKSETEKLKGFIDKLGEKDEQLFGLKDEMLAYQSKTLDKIQEERKKIVNTLSEPDDSGEKKQKLFLASQDQIAQFVRGVPHFIQSKRRLVESANRYLNLLRNRVNALVNVSNETFLDIDDSVSYVKTHEHLEAVKKIIADQAEWSQAQILTEVTKIVIPQSSGLANMLSTKRKALFEISPDAKDRMLELGYFSLWSDNFDPDKLGLNQNLMLLEMLIGINFMETGCTERRIDFIHKGVGYVFQETSKNDHSLVPKLIVSPERTHNPSYLVMNDAPDILKRTEEFWTKDHYLHNFLIMGSPLDPSGAMPMMGLPLIGQYEILLPNPPSGCSYSNATYYLYVAYAKKVRK